MQVTHCSGRIRKILKILEPDFWFFFSLGTQWPLRGDTCIDEKKKTIAKPTK